MKKNQIKMAVALFSILLITSCASLNKTQKGGAIGAVAGGAMGAVIGKAAGNTGLGAIIGAAVGGGTGAIIGNKMDKQAEEIKKTVPDAKVERVGEGIVVEFSSNVLFGFDSKNLSNEAKTNLDKLVKVLNVYPDTDIEVQGHTDSSGSQSYNQKLSKSRAQEVSKYLVNNGIKSSRINTVGFGEDLPKYDNNTESGMAQNRRVEFLISANEKMKNEAKKEAGQ